MNERLKTVTKALQDTEFIDIINELINNDKVKEMENYRQHYDISTFEHCLNVSYISYKICKLLKWDYKSMARAAMLHDLFLYDWRESKKKLNLEGYARIDFFYDEEKEEIYINEVNTIPGFTSISMYPKLIENEGINYTDLITILINNALNK